MLEAALLILAAGLLGQDPSAPGVIEGTVVNASRGGMPVANAEVVLRAGVDGQFVPVAQTLTNNLGNFRLQQLPVGNDLIYLPGANHEGIHYPGHRVQLTESQPQMSMLVAVHDTVSAPNPLVVRQHQIHLRSEPGALHVTERLLIDNPSDSTFVGEKTRDDKPPITLRLSLPADFVRVTFHKEFFGQSFSLDDQGLVTSIPWTPGERELAFTYTLPVHGKRYDWERPIDLPSDFVLIHVENTTDDAINCTLPSTDGSTRPAGSLQFQGRELVAGEVIRVEFGGLARPWTVWAKWLALGLLLSSSAAVGIVLARRQPGHSGADSRTKSSRRRKRHS